MEVLELEIVATAALLVSHLTIVVWNRVTRHSRRWSIGENRWRDFRGSQGPQPAHRGGVL